MKIPIAKIVIPERQRIDLGDIDSLADSLRDLGQINAITVRPEGDSYVLVAGRRRLAAASRLGWKEIKVDTSVDTSSQVLHERVELEEDVKRKDRTWQEKCIALAKLNDIITADKNFDGESWTSKQMAEFVGISATSVRYMLQVAAALRTTPKDEEIWATENYLSALKLLISRASQESDRELERRRQLLNKQNVAVSITPTPSASPGQQLTPTEAGETLPIVTPEQAQNPVIYLQGVNKAFEDAILGEDYSKHSAYCAIGLQCSQKAVDAVRLLLRPEGYAVFWDTEFDMIFGDMQMFDLFWNPLKPGNSDWPWNGNLVHGTAYRLAGTFPTRESTRPPVITAHWESENTLPSAVLDFSIADTWENAPIFLLNNANPIAIAELGRIPIWFEPDAERFKAQCDALEAYYKETIPGVEVRR